jgi:hypothetical protein
LNEGDNDHSILIDSLKKINKNVQNDPDEIWEALNHLCHKKFGYSDGINQTAKIEDVHWAAEILPMYSKWDKMNDYQAVINIWIEKLNRFMIKRNVDRHIVINPHSLGTPLSFTNFNYKAPVMPNYQTSSKKCEEKGKKTVKFIDNINADEIIADESSEGMYLKNNLNKIFH